MKQEKKLHPIRRRASTAIASLGLVAGSIFVGLLLGELVVRWVAPMPPAFSWVREDGLVLHAPGMRGTYVRQEFRVPVSINREGLRGPEIEPVKKPGTLRVLVVGDSYAEGLQVPWDDLVSTRLGRLLNAKPGPPVELINAGVSGYGTTDELMLLEKLGWGLKPDMVLLCFCVHNDVTDNLARPLYDFSTSPPRRREAPPPGKLALRILRVKEFLSRNSQLYQHLRMLTGGSVGETLVRWRIKRPKGNVAAEAVTDVGTDRSALFADPLPPRLSDGIEYTGQLLQRMKVEADEHHASLVVAWIPLREQVVEARWDALAERWGLPATNRGRPQAILSRVTEELGIFSVDLLPAFLREAPNHELYFRLDGHWTPEGHGIAADELAPVIQNWRMGDGPAPPDGKSNTQH